MKFRESDVYGREVVMNCQNCNTKIDYRFLTNCTHCGNEVVQSDLLVQRNTFPEFQSIEAVEKRLTWRRRLINLVYLFASSIAGMFSGAMFVCFGATMVFAAVLKIIDPDPRPGAYCGLGSAIGFFSIFGGAFLGTVGGTLFAVKHPLRKRTATSAT
jgi:hypothetical protein